MVTIAIVNRFAPPDPAPTGRAAADLALALAAALPDARVTLHASTAVYRPGRPTPVPHGLRVERVPSLYDGGWPPARLLASLLEGAALARRAAAAADVVITLSDPPLLPLWVARACHRRRRRWIEWSLDRYPEFFAAAGLIDPGHPLYRLVAGWEARLRPEAVIGLGPGQLAHLAARRGPLPSPLILPAGLVPSPPDHPEPEPAGPITLVHAGTLGQAHDPAALIALVERADPSRVRFRLAVTGRHAAACRRRLAGHPAVSWHDDLPEPDLAAAHAHLVTLAGPATHLCVPSKAVTAVCLGRPFLFLGPAEADTWQQLGAAGWRVSEPTGPALDAALTAVADPDQRRTRAAAAHRLAADLRRQYAATLALVAARITATPAPDPAATD